MCIYEKREQEIMISMSSNHFIYSIGEYLLEFMISKIFFFAMSLGPIFKLKKRVRIKAPHTHKPKIKNVIILFIVTLKMKLFTNKTTFFYNGIAQFT